jgi:hypothetical protein
MNKENEMKKQPLLFFNVLIYLIMFTSACAFVSIVEPTSTPSVTKTEVMAVQPSATPEPSPSPTPEPWTTWNGHEYRLTDPLPWLEAEAQAEAWGGTLVVIDHIEEEEWLFSQYGENESLWIGLAAIDRQYAWVWAAGTPVTFTNWCDGEPTYYADGEIEDAAVVSWSTQEGYGDCWNDISSFETLMGIVEREP